MQDAFFVRVRGRIPSILFDVRSLSFEADSSFSPVAYNSCLCVLLVFDSSNIVLLHTTSFSVNSITTFISNIMAVSQGKNLRIMYLSTFNLVETKILIFISPDRRNLNRGSCCTPNFDLRYHLPSASLHYKCFDLLILKIHNLFQAESYLF